MWRSVVYDLQVPVNTHYNTLEERFGLVTGGFQNSGRVVGWGAPKEGTLGTVKCSPLLGLDYVCFRLVCK